jgi:hypothetical protein
MKLFDKMKEIESKAAPIEKWTGSMNYPFYGDLDKPRPSLSKHEGTEHDQRMLHCDDLSFILVSRRTVPKLLKALDIATNALYAISEIDDTGTGDYIESLVSESLEKIEELNEES